MCERLLEALALKGRDAVVRLSSSNCTDFPSTKLSEVVSFIRRSSAMISQYIRWVVFGNSSSLSYVYYLYLCFVDSLWSTAGQRSFCYFGSSNWTLMSVFSRFILIHSLCAILQTKVWTFNRSSVQVVQIHIGVENCDLVLYYSHHFFSSWRH